jgi:hypothetical protein
LRIKSSKSNVRTIFFWMKHSAEKVSRDRPPLTAHICSQIQSAGISKIVF